MLLTPELLRAGYTMLCEVKPFCDWGLPFADDVIFEVKKGRGILCGTTYGEHWTADGHHHIRLYESAHGRLAMVMATLAHEMCHLYIAENSVKDTGMHGRSFKKLARAVCAHIRDFDLEFF